jgi:hypothetical protein
MHQHQHHHPDSHAQSVESHTAARLARVEAQLSRTRMGLALCVCAGAAIMLMAAGGVERLVGGLPVLRAGGLIIVDENNQDRITLKINDQNQAEFKVLDAQGKDTFHAP